jgi:antitoxin component YwqK of YwqJK toxin-antitoxin module
MLKLYLLTLAIFAMCLSTFGQTAIDTVVVYSFPFSITKEGSSKVIYTANGKVTDKETIQKITETRRKRDSYDLCYVIYIDIDGNKLSSGLYYPKCDTTVAYTEEVKEGFQSKQMSRVSNGCEDGKWLYYGSNGEIEQVKYFKKGVEIPGQKD